jgi:riboflavin kinase/FMN adenylyltransferase
MSKVFRDVAGPCLTPPGSVVCIGAFDGLHRGHQALLDATRARADALGLEAVAVSFEPLPRQHFQGRDVVARLASPRQKLEVLLVHVDRVGLLRFGEALAAMEPEAFVDSVLVQRLVAREVWVGAEFRFGRGRRGDVALLAELGRTRGYAVRTLDAVVAGGERISSTRIRALLAASDFDGAKRLLGRRFAVQGHVVRGNRLGHQLGYPTANLRIAYGRAPVQGIFAARVEVAGLRHWPSVASLGTRPTVNGTEPLLEAHLFDYDGDLYGRLLTLEFVAKLRDEARFDSLPALVEQIHRDAAQARAILSRGPDLEEALTA